MIAVACLLISSVALTGAYRRSAKLKRGKSLRLSPKATTSHGFIRSIISWAVVALETPLGYISRFPLRADDYS